MVNSKAKLILTMFSLGLFAFSCGEDDDSVEDLVSGPSITSFGPSAIETDSQIMSLALNVLSSTSLGSISSLALESSVSTVYPGCSSHGEPWDSETSSRMQPDNNEFAKQTFYCQLKSDESPDTVQGSFARNYNILCSIEEALGGPLQYNGESSDVAIFPSAACGWSEGAVSEAPEEGYEVTVTGSTLTEGEWNRSIEISLGEEEGFEILIANNADSISFKSVDTWTHEEGRNEALGSRDVSGKSGGVIALNFAEGVLRGEIVDTYWGRRARIYAEGTIDSESAEFTEITKMEGLQGNFGISGDGTQAYIELASVKGDSTDGFKFNSVQMTCNDGPCDASVDITASTINQTGTECYPSTASCEGNDGIALGQTADDYSFWKFGADMDEQDGTRATVETWLEGAGIPNFTEVDKSVTID